MNNNDTQSRKWQLTINNPKEHDFSHEKIKELISKIKSCTYWCMSDETGENGTYHTHIYIHCSSGLRFSTIKNKFPTAHIEIAKGTAAENRDYIYKEGKWLNSEKGTTNHRDTHEESGDCPVERQGQRNDLSDLYDMIKDGMTTYQILESAPQYITYLDKIERVRQVIAEEKFSDEWRNIDTTYIWGVTGTGKTRSVMDKYGYRNVYRVTDYIHPFDGYKGQDVIVFEEFRSNLPIDDMLKYLDGYPVDFPARYANKTACFTKVFIISNEDIRTLYRNVQLDKPNTWKAFLRRINTVQVFDGKTISIFDCKDYIKSGFGMLPDIDFESVGTKNEQ